MATSKGKTAKGSGDTYASGWDALADTPEQAANLRARAELMRQIADVVKDSGWTQVDAANRCGITQPRINDLLRGRVSRFSIDALVIPKYSPMSQAETLRLVTVTQTEQGGAPPSPWSDMRTAIEAILHEVERMFIKPGNTAGWWDLAKNLVEDLVTGNVPMVFLKQFRDVVDPSKACYQAVIEAPSHLQKFYGGWFTPPHDIAIIRSFGF